MSDALTKLCGVFCVISFITLLTLILVSLKSLEINEIGLDYSSISKTIDSNPLGSGLYFLGVGHSLIKYPSNIQTIQFSNEKGSHGPPIKSRTSEGLDVSIEISFQYKLNQQHLYSLYMTYQHEYLKVFQRFAQNVLTESTTFYTAYQFFKERVIIAQKMQELLNAEFSQKLFSQVVFFQLRSVDLPDRFEKSIEQTEVLRQDINKAHAEKNKSIVELQTQLMAADYDSKVILNLAQGEADSIVIAANANSLAYKMVQNNQTLLYSSMITKNQFTNDVFLKYLKCKVIQNFNSTNQVVSISQIEAA